MKRKTYLLLLLFFLTLTTLPARAGECDTPKEGWLFCDDFETGNFNKWSQVWTTTDISLVPPPRDSFVALTPPSPGGLYVAQFHYVLPSGGSAHLDSNRFLRWSRPPEPLNHVFVRGYVLIPKNTQLYGLTRSIQRKLFYFFSNDWDTSTSKGFGFFLTTDVPEPIDLSIDYVVLRLGYGELGGTRASLRSLGRIKAGRWTAVEIEVKVNTPGQSDGIFRLWLDSILVYENITMDYRSPYGNSSAGIQAVQVGDQADRLNNDPVDEYRYWDDIVISTKYIGSLTPPDRVRLE